MKIAFVRRDYTPKGGAEKYLVNLSSELVRMGEAVHIVAHTCQGPPHPKITVHPVPMVPVISPLKNLSFALGAARELKRLNVDIICGLSRGFHHDIFRISDGLHLFHMRQRYGTGMRYLFKSLTPRHRTLLYLEKKSLLAPGLKRVITNSFLAKAQVSHYYHLPEEKISVIYNGIDPSVFNPSVRDRHRSTGRKSFGIGEDETVILFVALDPERKGFILLLEALSLLKGENFKLLAVGMTDRKEYRKRVAESGLAGKVIFIGYHSRIEEVYGMGDMLVLPTFYDPFANCCLEAMASGIPVITTRQNGASELIDNGTDGFVVDEPSRVTDLAERIGRLAERETRERMGRQASLSVRGLTVEENAKRTLNLFKQVLKEKTL